MHARSFADDVVKRLGNDSIRRIAALLGVDETAARRIAHESVVPVVSALVSDVGRNRTEATRVAGAINEAMPVAGPAAGKKPRTALVGIKGGILALVVRKAAGPAARRIAKRTGLPVRVSITLAEMLLPAVIGVLAKRLKARSAGRGVGAMDVGTAMTSEAALPSRRYRRGPLGIVDRVSALRRH
ncbi:MAG: hypothetical protein HOV66_18690 [Streptomycetaceae bacterium]|jgi:hypothetical protein|nr:hypothetical protein [Streptomycetaceae bacterium]NUS56862.1 hypothetical protein [Streptomycetaceae bacterium]